MDRRPWLTLAILDVFTHAWSSGFICPWTSSSRVSASRPLHQCQLNAVYDKSAWLKEREIAITSWPAVMGLPETVHSDNENADFRSRAFAWACREEGIKLIFRPIGTPHYGGHIERLIGTTMARVHFYPGSTFANSRGRSPGQRSRALRSHDVPRVRMRARQEIAGRYNQQIHSALLRPPHCAVARTRGFAGFAHAQGPHGLLGLVSTRRSSNSSFGWDLKLHDIPYWSNALSGQVGRTKRDLLRQVRSKGRLPNIRPAPRRSFHRGARPLARVPSHQSAGVEAGSESARGEGQGREERRADHQDCASAAQTGIDALQSPRPPPRDERLTRQKILGMWRMISAS